MTPPDPGGVRPTHPAFLACAAVAALCLIAAVTFRIFDTDVWQHLLVGRVIWDQLSVPTRQVWSWPTFGAPDLNASWGFEALLWPLWNAGGVTGLYVWRWVTALATFAITLVTARRMGARGLAPFVIAVIAALVYRQRSQMRPESLAALLLAAELWLLESRRAGLRVPALAVLPLLWIWVNTHISYHVGFLVLGAYALDETVAHRRVSGLWLAIPAGLALGLLNPFGWRALWEPFRYVLFERGERIFTTIGELQPVVWAANWRNGLPLIVAGWPLLALWRVRRRLDLAELILCPTFVLLALGGVRFVVLLAVVAVPFMARDLAEWMAARFGSRPPRPIWARAAAVALAAVGLVAFEVRGSDFQPGIGFEWRSYPVRASDAIEARGLRGRIFNPFHYGGYLLYRFWPERDRLPFMDIHATGTREDRRMAMDAQRDPAAWRRFFDTMGFDLALLARPAFPGDHTADYLDADTSWALVFLDDAAALYVRRTGSAGAVAERDAYRLIPAGNARAAMLGAAAARSPQVRARARAELERQLRESPYNALAHRLLASIALSEGRLEEARDHLRIVVRELPREIELKRTLAELERRLGDSP